MMLVMMVESLRMMLELGNDEEWPILWLVLFVVFSPYIRDRRQTKHMSKKRGKKKEKKGKRKLNGEDGTEVPLASYPKPT